MCRPSPNLFHHSTVLYGINNTPVGVPAVLLNDRNSGGRGQGVFADGWIAQEAVQLQQNLFTEKKLLVVLVP